VKAGGLFACSNEENALLAEAFDEYRDTEWRIHEGFASFYVTPKIKEA